MQKNEAKNQIPYHGVIFLHSLRVYVFSSFFLSFLFVIYSAKAFSWLLLKYNDRLATLVFSFSSSRHIWKIAFPPQVPFGFFLLLIACDFFSFSFLFTIESKEQVKRSKPL